jgi:hypothetical protein
MTAVRTIAAATSRSAPVPNARWPPLVSAAAGAAPACSAVAVRDAASVLSEQARGQQQIDHHPGREITQPGLNLAGFSQRRIDHLKRQHLGEPTLVAGCEPAPGHGDRGSDDAAIQPE